MESLGVVQFRVYEVLTGSIHVITSSGSIVLERT